MKKKNKIVYSLLLLYIATMHGTTTVFHRYLWANYNHFSGKLTTAHNWYSSLFSSHHSLYSYKGYLHFLFDTKQYVKITELIPSLDKKFEKDPEIQLLFVLALEKNKQTQEADSRLIKLNSSFKSNADIALRTTQAYVRRKEPENALSTIDTFLNNSPRKSNNFIFYYLKSQIHLQISQLPEALSTVTVCLDMHPQFDKGWLLFATLQEQKGEIQKALQGYATFLELSGGNNTVEKHLFSLMLQHKTNSNHVPFHKSYFDWAVAFYQKKEYKSALLYINKYLTLQPHTYEALVLKLHIVAQLDHKKIADFMIEVLKTDPHNQAWPKNIYLLQHD